MKIRNNLLVLAALLTLPACGGGMTIGGRIDIAQDTAAQAQLTRHDYIASPFILAGWQRITDTAAPINIYIEGDGSAWLNRTTPSRNPTPKNAIALKLAAKDNASNVVYLARPCQFTKLSAPGNNCSDFYWRGGRFAPDVIQSFNSALDQIAKRTNGAGFNLIGFSGGANIAGLLAERRTDILSIRTVAGNVDNDAFVDLHKVSAMPSSLNMAAKASEIAHIPQLHLIGGDDENVPAMIFESYRQKAGESTCIHSKILGGISHDSGWEEQWPTLLALPFVCATQ